MTSFAVCNSLLLVMEFQIGDKFSSFAELQSRIDSYSKNNYHDLHRRDSRTLDAAVRQKRIIPERVRNKELKYYELSYHCVHIGRDNYKSCGNDARKSKMFQLGCQTRPSPDLCSRFMLTYILQQ